MKLKKTNKLNHKIFKKMMMIKLDKKLIKQKQLKIRI